MAKDQSFFTCPTAAFLNGLRRGHEMPSQVFSEPGGQMQPSRFIGWVVGGYPPPIGRANTPVMHCGHPEAVIGQPGTEQLNVMVHCPGECEPVGLMKGHI